MDPNNNNSTGFPPASDPSASSPTTPPTPPTDMSMGVPSAQPSASSPLPDTSDLGPSASSGLSSGFSMSNPVPNVTPEPAPNLEGTSTTPLGSNAALGEAQRGAGAGGVPSWSTPGSSPSAVPSQDMSASAAPAFGSMDTTPSEAPVNPMAAGTDSSAPSGAAPGGFSIADLASGPGTSSTSGLDGFSGGTPPLSSTDASVSAPSVSPAPADTVSASPLGGSGNSETAPANPFMGGSQPSMSETTAAPNGGSGAETGASASGPVESAPTDLSHLVSGASGEQSATSSTIPQPETLVVAPSAAPAASDAQVVSGGGKSFPKWILAVAFVVVLAVIGASAYFILGVGKPEAPTTSVPAVQAPLTKPPKTVLPSVSPTQAPASGSATFGSLEGTAPVSSSGSAAQNGPSALELLRKRQVSPTP